MRTTKMRRGGATATTTMCKNRAPQKSAGINTVRWNLEARRERVQGEPAPAGGRGGRGGGGGGGAQPAAGAFVSTPVEPGQYRVVLSVGGRDYTQTGVVMADPNFGGK